MQTEVTMLKQRWHHEDGLGPEYVTTLLNLQVIYFSPKAILVPLFPHSTLWKWAFYTTRTYIRAFHLPSFFPGPTPE